MRKRIVFVKLSFQCLGFHFLLRGDREPLYTWLMDNQGLEGFPKPLNAV